MNPADLIIDLRDLLRRFGRVAIREAVNGIRRKPTLAPYLSSCVSGMRASLRFPVDGKELTSSDALNLLTDRDPETRRKAGLALSVRCSAKGKASLSPPISRVRAVTVRPPIASTMPLSA